MRLSLPSSLRQLNPFRSLNWGFERAHQLPFLICESSPCIVVSKRSFSDSIDYSASFVVAIQVVVPCKRERLLPYGNDTRLLSPSILTCDNSAQVRRRLAAAVALKIVLEALNSHRACRRIGKSAITMSSHQHQPRTPANPSWIWAGVHGASGIVHPFLATRDDPNQRYSGLGDNPENLVLAGSGGLLLIKRSPPDVDYTLSDHENFDTLRELANLLRRMRLLGTEEDDESNNTPEDDQFQSSLEFDQHWQTLMVVNPSTHESRVLPPANSLEVGLEFWSYNGVQANLLVDTESQYYTVTLTFPDCVCLYSSTSNAWQCRSFNQGASWGPHNRELLANPWQMQIANAYVNGRLFFADIVVEDPIPTMNLIEIDVEAGSWKLHNWRYSLQTQFTEFVDTPFLRMRGLTDHGMHQAVNTQTLASRRHGRVLGNFQIVECMGELYAVNPMSLSEYLPMSLRSRRTLTEVVYEYANFGLSFMPLQFLIVNMRGDGFVHGALRILVPEDVSSVVGSEFDIDNEYRQIVLMSMLGLGPIEVISWGFSCVAEGSVIWVALLDYVLQYDVLTGVSKTEIIGASSREMSLDVGLNRPSVPYRPSDMKP